MRECNKCFEKKELTEFSFRSDAQVYRRDCKACVCKRNMAAYYSNPKKYLTKFANAYANNPEPTKARSKKWYYENREKALLYSKKYRQENAEILKPKHAARQKKRETLKRNACPKWLTKEQFMEMECVYIAAKILQKIDGVPREVDHIMPLNNPILCGLHVPWNLQILTEIENIQKSNKILECA